MDLATWALFAGLAAAATASPGPAVLLAVTNSLTHGFATSVYASLDNITGLFIVSVAAALGLGVVIRTSRCCSRPLNPSAPLTNCGTPRPPPARSHPLPDPCAPAGSCDNRSHRICNPSARRAISRFRPDATPSPKDRYP
jgi:hypothetical protein